jgi:gliding motility-associated-like protein
MLKKINFIFLTLLLYSAAKAQNCTTPGQSPSTAFPVCGTKTFKQAEVPLCVSHELAVPGCSDTRSTYEDRNPFWYKFTCYEAGTLGFLIKPMEQNEDYDWQLYDITGRDPNDVFTDPSMTVTGNWAGTYGETGTSDTGVDFIQCGSDPNDKLNTFAKMPQLIAGHTYLLLISHFTNTQSGYDLSFSGGTAVINDPVVPHLETVEANCGSDQLRIKLDKSIKCSSIAPDGSDFTLSGTSIQVASSIGVDCNEKFDSDSLVLQLSGPLAPGTYTLGVKSGSDGNTLLDYCDNQVAQTDVLQITILPKQPTPMDSLVPVTCAPDKLTLIFKKPINCASIAANGSDFRVNGTYPVQVTAAAGTCSEGLSKEIIVTLDRPLQLTGAFSLVLQRGTDGNTIIDECGEETPAGSSLSFSVKDTVNADFTYNISYGCLRDSVQFFHPGGNGIDSWNWNLDERQQSTAQNPQGIYAVFNEKNISLTVSNGFCSHTVSNQVLLDNYIKADFTVFQDNCPNEAIPFNGTPQGNILTHHWDFGDGNSATQQTTLYTYGEPERERTYNVRYTVTDKHGCQSTAARPVTIYTSCYLAVPTAFTPNGDGRNDFLAPMNAVKAVDLEFRVFNRWGQLLYASSNWKQGWDGRYKGQLQPSATYVWMLRFTNRDTGKKGEQKGTAVLIR